MKLQILTSTVKDGIMSDKRIYFPTLTKEDRAMLYENTLNRFAQKIGLTKENIVIIEDTADKITVGKAVKNKQKMKTKITLLKSTTNNLVVAIPTEDDPVIIASAKVNEQESVAAIAKVTLENLNKNILHEIIEALMKETDKAPFEMTFYISSCPTQEEYCVDKENPILKNDSFKSAVKKIKNNYYFDIKYAIFNQLVSEIVDPNYIYFSEISSVTDTRYFSKIGNRPGQNLVCMVYQDEEI